MRFVFKFLGVLIGLAVAASVAISVFILTLVPDLPTIDSLKDVPLKVPLRVFSVHGELVAEFGEERREPVSIDQVPEKLVQAILAAEDERFYSHPGVDFMGVLRAAMANLRAGGNEQGASTITMQVARNYFLTREKTYTRKLREALLSFRLERSLTKDQILELYLNKIFLGHRAYGFAAAAKVYYGKPLGELAIPQIAMLAGLPKAPSRDNPLTNEIRARDRRNYVLRRMHSLGYVTDEQMDLATQAPITASKHAVPTEIEAPYVAEMVRNYMLEEYGEEAYWRGFNVYTTIVGAYQETAQQALRKGLKSYDRRHGYRGPISQHEISVETTQKELDSKLEIVQRSGKLIPAIVVSIEGQGATVYTRDKTLVELSWEGISWARPYVSVDEIGASAKAVEEVLTIGDIVYVEEDDDEASWRLSQLPAIAGGLVSIRPQDGAILALTGGFDFYLSKFNRIMQAERQPGSNIKPFIYSAALSNGFTPASLVSGAPIVVADESQDTVWRPENYSRKFFGPTRLRRALSLSLNLVSVRILRAIGVEAALDHLSKFGIDPDKMPKGLSLALGSGTIKPIEVVRAYAVFANGGYRVEPYFISWIEDQYGDVIEQAKPQVVCTACSGLPGPVTEEPLLHAEPDSHTNVSEAQESGDSVTGPMQEENEQEPLKQGEVALRVLDSGNHFLITDMLKQVVRSGTARRALQLKRADLAGKTGTTNDYKDAWFSGFNRDVVTTVWVGFDDSSTLGRREAGSKAALPVWIDYMRVALEGKKERIFLPPDNVVTRYVDKDSGDVVRPKAPNGYEEYFLVSNVPPDLPNNSFSNTESEGAPASIPQQPATTEGLF